MNTNDPTVRLPIFISYGHQSHEETVLKIKDALEVRGHKIWIDTEGIREGTDWRRKIYDGILNSRLFLAFVSKKSVQSEYCQTEIRIAVGAPQNLLPVCPLMLENVKVPQSISHIQTVNFVYDENDPSAFEQKLKQIIDWIDLPEHEAFCREMEELREKLGRPESFEARLGVLMSQPFVGRQWLLEKINEWDKADSRLFGIIGGPGFGKSIFAANLRSLAPAKVAAAQFIEWDKTSKYTPKQIIKSLAFQLAFRISQYRELLIDAVKNVDLDSLDESSLFTKLLSEPLVFENPNNTYWVILDALDEATGRDGQNPFVQTLMRNMDQLPKWLKFIVTSRPDASVVTYLKHRGIQLFDTDSEIRRAQHDDMMEYLRGELKECRFGDDVLEGLAAKSQGMFLYLYFVCRDILQNHLSAEDISRMPTGIDAIYQKYFDRQFGGDRYSVFTSELRPILRLCCSSREPLPLDFIAEVVGKSVEEVRAAIDQLGTLKNYSSENGRDYFNLVHKSIWDWLAAQPNDSTTQTFRVAPEDGLPALKDFCLKKIRGYQPGRLSKDVNCEYPLKHVIEHLIALSDLETVWELLGGNEPLLSKIQIDYFGNYNAAIASLEQASAFYLEQYLAEKIAEKKHAFLTSATRLVISFQNLQSQRRERLRNLFKPGNTLDQVLEMMEGITDPRQYFMVGCYLLTKAKTEHWDIGTLIEAIVEKCKDRIPQLDEPNFNTLFLPEQNRQFLLYGIFMTPLEQDIPDDLGEKLMSCLSKDDFQGFMELAGKVMETPQARFDNELLPAELREEKYTLAILEDAAYEQEKQRILAIEDITERIAGLQELARYCAAHESGDHVEELVHVLDGEYEKSPDFQAAPLPDIINAFNWYNLAGKAESGKNYLLSKEKLFTSLGCEMLFLGELCKAGLHEDAYSRFEAMTIRSLTKSQKKTQPLISPFQILRKLCSLGQWDLVRKKVQEMINEGNVSENIGNHTRLLAGLIVAGQEELAQELLSALLEKCENPVDSLLKSPGLLHVMKQLQEKGLWDDDIPSWDELKEGFEFCQGRPMTLADCREIQERIMMIRDVTRDANWRADTELSVPDDIQFGLLKSAWELFLDPPSSDNSDEPPAEMSFDDFVAGLQEKASSAAGDEGSEVDFDELSELMKGLVGPVSVDGSGLLAAAEGKCDGLGLIAKILDDMPHSGEKPEYKEQLAECFTHLAGLADTWDIDKDKDAFSLLLKNSGFLPEGVFSKFVEVTAAKIIAADASDCSVGGLIEEFTECLFRHGMKDAAMEFPGELQNESNRDYALKNLQPEEQLLFWEEGSRTDAERTKALLKMLSSSLFDCKCKKEKVDIDKTVSAVLERLKKYFSPTKDNMGELCSSLTNTGEVRQMPPVRKVIDFVTERLTDIIQSEHYELLPEAYKLSSSAAVLPYELLQQISRHADYSDEGKADVILDWMKENDWNDDLFTETAALIRGIKDKDQQNELMTKLLAVCLRKKYRKGVDECLDRLDGSALVAGADSLRDVPLTEISRELREHNIQPRFIADILGKLGLIGLINTGFDDLCGVAAYLLSDDRYIRRLIKQLAKFLLDDDDQETLKEIALTCPELGIAYLFEEPAGSIPVDDILELRRQLAEEEITRKGYNKKITALLEGVTEDVKARFEVLEQQLDEEDVTLKGYAKKLVEIFPK